MEFIKRESGERMADPSFAVLQKVRNGERTFGITPRIPGGFISPQDLITIAQVAEKYKGQIKITSGQRITILRIKPEDVENAWNDLGMEPGVRSAFTVKNVEICPSAFCKRSKQNSLKLGLRLEKKYYGRPAPNRTKFGVAGCLNACTSANSKDIAILSSQDGYIIRVGGSAGYHPRLPDEVASGLTEDQAENMVDSIFEYYSENAAMGDKIGPFIDRIGFDTFLKGVMQIYNKKEGII
jgi:NAD(P)H-nitrite reductase